MSKHIETLHESTNLTGQTIEVWGVAGDDVLFLTVTRPLGEDKAKAVVVSVDNKDLKRLVTVLNQHLHKADRYGSGS